MIQLRFVGEYDGDRIIKKLQYREVPTQIGWLPNEDRPVIQPSNKIDLRPEKNWTEWKDVEYVGIE